MFRPSISTQELFIAALLHTDENLRLEAAKVLALHRELDMEGARYVFALARSGSMDETLQEVGLYRATRVAAGFIGELAYGGCYKELSDMTSDASLPHNLQSLALSELPIAAENAIRKFDNASMDPQMHRQLLAIISDPRLDESKRLKAAERLRSVASCVTEIHLDRESLAKYTTFVRGAGKGPNGIELGKTIKT